MNVAMKTFVQTDCPQHPIMLHSPCTPASISRPAPPLTSATPSMGHTQQQEKEDAAQIEQLKKKWQDHSARDNTGVAEDHDNSSSLANTRVCQVCQGSGLQTEVYEFRRMEHTCTHCQGEGLLFLGGAKLKNDNQQPQKASTSTGSSRQDEHRKHRSAQALAKLQKRIDELSQEEADLLAALDTTHREGSTTAQQSLEGHLLQELRRHLEQLRQEQQRRMAGTA